MNASTTREILDKALKRRKELVSELETLEEIIATCSKALEREGLARRATEDEPGLFRAPSPRAAHAEQITKMIDVARRILLSEQRPMQRGELRQRVEATGFQVIGKDKNRVFGTNLWRSKKFKMIEGQGYWPIGEDLPR